MMKTLGAAIGLFMLSAGTAQAANCDHPVSGFDNVYCFAKVYMDLDRQLNDNYVVLMRSIKPAQAQVLREGQRRWIEARNARCYRSEGRGNIVNIDCALSTTRRRIQFLSDRLAECRATGCSVSRLGTGTEADDRN